jgi:hypothetical protein
MTAEALLGFPEEAMRVAWRTDFGVGQLRHDC